MARLGRQRWFRGSSRPLSRRTRAGLEVAALEPRIVPSQAPLTPPEIAHAYGFDQIKLPGGYTANGQGQTIAIIEQGYTPDTLLTPALTNFDAGDAADGFNYTLPALTADHFQQVDLSNGQDAGAEVETLLDVEWAHALAPAANILVFDAAVGSSQAQSLDYFMAAVKAATQYDGPLGQVSVVSMSYGWHEDQVPGDKRPSYDALFTTPANHIGITFLASTGDDGAGPQQRYPTDKLGANGNEPPEYPSSSPNVIGVGGTALVFPSGDTSFAYPGVATSPNGVGESAWGNGDLSFNRHDTTPPGGGSGGGISLWEGEPTYQSKYGLHYSNGTSNARTTPDVSFDADGQNSPVLIYDGYDHDHRTGQLITWGAEGGTSFSTPAWAALIAIADEARAANNLGSLDGATQTLPDLYNLSGNDYHDITQGSDGYSAAPGYDLATGLGTPVASRVVGDLWGQGPPVAKNASYTVAAGTTLDVPAANGLLVNATDPMGEPLTVVSHTNPVDGSLTVRQDGSFTYTPNNNFFGTDSFNYTILDTGTGVGSTATVTITVSQTLPDLAPYTPTGWSGPIVVTNQPGGTTTPGTLTTADTVYVDWAVVNQGNAPVNTAFGVQLLLDGTPVNTWSPSVPLAAGSFTDFTSYRLGPLAAGSHTVTVVADYQNQVAESNKDNNTFRYTFTVTPAGLPDLAPYTPPGWGGPVVVATQTGATTSAATFSTGDTVYVNWAVVNQGNASVTTPFQVELLLDGTPVKTWTATVPMDPNTYTNIRDYSLGQLQAGTHTVTVVDDYLNQVTESDKTNDAASYTFTVTQPPLPELAPFTPVGWSGPLVVTTLQGSTTTATVISTTNTVYVNWAFVNQGNATIDSAFQVELLLDGTAVKTWSGPVPLDPSYYTYINDFSLGQLAEGSHTLTAIADSLDQVTQSDRSKNTITYTFTVTSGGLPDLAPYTPPGWTGPIVVSTQAGTTTTTASITTTDTVYLDWAFVNQGNAAVTNSFGVELLLDGTQVNTWSASVPLDPNFYTHIQDYSLGQLTAGRHTVTLIADYLDQVPQSDRSANTVTYTFTVTPAALPDLAPFTPTGWGGPLVVSTQTGDTTTAPTIATTDTVYVDWAFVNQGNATINTTFHTELLLDGTQVHTWFTSPPVGPTIDVYVKDYNLGRLTAGSHTIAVVTDYLNEVTESNRDNNTLTYQFTVTPVLVPPPPAGPSPSPPAPAAASGNVTGLVQVTFGRPRFNAGARRQTLTVTLRNGSSTALEGAIWAVVTDLTRKVRLRHASGFAGGPGLAHKPVLRVPADGLAPGGTVSFVLDVSGLGSRRRSFNLLVFAGQVP